MLHSLVFALSDIWEVVQMEWIRHIFKEIYLLPISERIFLLVFFREMDINTEKETIVQKSHRKVGKWCWHVILSWPVECKNIHCNFYYSYVFLLINKQTYYLAFKPRCLTYEILHFIGRKGTLVTHHHIPRMKLKCIKSVQLPAHLLCHYKFSYACPKWF